MRPGHDLGSMKHFGLTRDFFGPFTLVQRVIHTYKTRCRDGVLTDMLRYEDNGEIKTFFKP